MVWRRLESLKCDKDEIWVMWSNALTLIALCNVTAERHLSRFTSCGCWSCRSSSMNAFADDSKNRSESSVWRLVMLAQRAIYNWREEKRTTCRLWNIIGRMINCRQSNNSKEDWRVFGESEANEEQTQWQKEIEFKIEEGGEEEGTCKSDQL